MSDESILRSPKEHLARANQLAERSRFLEITARELQITDGMAAAWLKGHAAIDKQAAIYHIAQALEAMAVLKKLGLVD